MKRVKNISAVDFQKKIWSIDFFQKNRKSADLKIDNFISTFRAIFRANPTYDTV